MYNAEIYEDDPYHSAGQFVKVKAIFNLVSKTGITVLQTYFIKCICEIVGIQIQSDLDSDTEIDILKRADDSQKDDQDDFYDFYE